MPTMRWKCTLTMFEQILISIRTRTMGCRPSPWVTSCSATILRAEPELTTTRPSPVTPWPSGTESSPRRNGCWYTVARDTGDPSSLIFTLHGNGIGTDTGNILKVHNSVEIFIIVWGGHGDQDPLFTIVSVLLQCRCTGSSPVPCKVNKPSRSPERILVHAA